MCRKNGNYLSILSEINLDYFIMIVNGVAADLESYKKSNKVFLNN